MEFKKIESRYDKELAGLIRVNLEKVHLDIPGTVYYDENLDHLSDFYLADPARRFYYIAVDDSDRLVGGVGLAQIDIFEDCCELQKLYLSDDVKGAGLSYRMISMIEDKARELGFKRIYLETHDCLEAAIHVYRKTGYREIEKPEGLVHATMNKFFIKEL